jgi:P-type conjugative transfer protein TrbG
MVSEAAGVRMRTWFFVAALFASTAAVMPVMAQEGGVQVPNIGAPARPIPAETEARIANQWKKIEQDMQLRDFDRKAMQEAKRFHDAKNAPPPVLGGNGKVIVGYGSTIPRLVTQPMRVSVIELQEGEIVTSNPHTGDADRWIISPAVSGEGPTTTWHVIVKPKMANISTNLTINTNKRSYDIELVSRNSGYMPRLAFSYPEEEQAAWDKLMQEQRSRRENELSAYDGPQISAKDLHFNYGISGSAAWKPLRAYDDGRKTFIEFPAEVRYGTAPILLLMENGVEKQVNYRMQDRYFVVDRLFNEALLVQGTGWGRTAVTIERQRS